jgi:hypothetical protein
VVAADDLAAKSKPHDLTWRAIINGRAPCLFLRHHREPPVLTRRLSLFQLRDHGERIDTLPVAKEKLMQAAPAASFNRTAHPRLTECVRESLNFYT